MKQSDAGITGGSASSTQGATKTELKEGYFNPCKGSKELDDVEMASPFDSQDGGFAGRPSGWER